MNRYTDWIDDAQGIAAQFRLGMSVPAALTMVEFIGRLANGGGALPPLLASEFGQLVGKMLACQEAHDWLGLADYLDTEMVDWLKRLQDADGTRP